MTKAEMRQRPGRNRSRGVAGGLRVTEGGTCQKGWGVTQAEAHQRPGQGEAVRQPGEAKDEMMQPNRVSPKPQPT
ncbi:hypothetical protein Aab01nite_36950 [Paractinoplanes abujensis]|nr:hypothetical protein Aab01nite_36950 [Actinoplanes abujensis]